MKLEYWDWEDTFMTILAVAVVVALVLAAFVSVAPHNVDYYYLSHGGGSNIAACAYAHWTWHSDEIAFCSDDSSKVIDFVAKANATIKK